MQTLIRAIKRSSLVIAILTVLATCAVFVPPAHHASAASSPYISLQYNGSGYNLVGQGFSAGKTVFLGRYTLVNGQYQLQASDYVTAAQCFVALYPYVHCTNNVAPGTFTYNGPGALGVYYCGGYYYYAYDYNTATWSNPIYVYPCIH